MVQVCLKKVLLFWIFRGLFYSALDNFSCALRAKGALPRNRMPSGITSLLQQPQELQGNSLERWPAK